MKKSVTAPVQLYIEHVRALCAAIVLGFVFFAPYFVFAADDAWTVRSLVRQAGGGVERPLTKQGDAFVAKAVAMSDDGSKIVLYANTTAFEAGYFVSTDGGVTWTDRTYASGAALKGGFRFGAVSGDGSRFFALEPVYQSFSSVIRTGYALKVSFDNGATWGGLTFPVAGGENPRYAANRCFDQECRAQRMSMDEAGPIYSISHNGSKLLYIANWSGDDSCSGACQSIWISNDGGNSWFKSKEWRGGSFRKALSTTIPPGYSDDMNTIMLVGSSNGVVSETSRLFFSRDGGVSWNERDFGSSISAVAAPGNGATMIVAMSNQVYKSTDGGTSWFLDATVPTNVAYTEKVTSDIKAVSGNGTLLVAGIAGRGEFMSLGRDFDGPARLPVSFDHGKTWTKKLLPAYPGGFSFDTVLGVSRQANKVLMTSGSDVFVSGATPDTSVWTQYCTGANDPNGNNWQWWEKNDANPIQYRFVRRGDGTCTELWQSVQPQPKQSVLVPATSAPTGTLAATTCTASSASATCKVSARWTAQQSKDNWTQVNVVTPNGVTVDSYKTQKAESSHTFQLAPGTYALALIAWKQDDAPVIVHSTTVVVDVSAAPVANNKAPVGYLDSATCSAIKGWAYDPDDQNANILIGLYDDTTLLGYFKADAVRPDVNRVMGIVGNHGFSFPAPTTLKDGKAHTLRVYAVDSSGGTTTHIQKSPVTITCASAAAPNTQVVAMELFPTTASMLASVASSVTMPFDIVTDAFADTLFMLGLY